VRCRFGVSILLNFAVACGNEEDLKGTEASPFDGGAAFVSQPGGRVSKIARKPFFPRKHSLSRVVPQWYHFLFEMVPSKTTEM
jgi:hypothetical protein